MWTIANGIWQTVAAARSMPWFAVAGLLVFSPGGNAEDAWVAEELFKQIAELRQSVQELRAEVSELKSALNKKSAENLAIPLNTTNQQGIGSTTAKVGIVEFMDYECPFCRKHFSSVFPKLKAQFIDKGIVRYVVKDFPLEFHNQALAAAVAVRCAGSQGQYWNLRGKLFGASEHLGEHLIEQSARDLGLSIDRLSVCSKDSSVKAGIRSDIELGTSLGVTGTPSFFIGRIEGDALRDYEHLEGAQSVDEFSSAIGRILDTKHN